MTTRRLHSIQPTSFSFTKENISLCQQWIKKYPEDRLASAVVPVLTIAQNQHNGWLPKPAIEAVANMLRMPYIRVLEIATFYTMFNLMPVGRYLVQVCGTTPCWLRGADSLKLVCKRKIGAFEKVTDDGIFSWREVECLGACANAPLVQINENNYEDLTPEILTNILDALKNKETPAPTPGPQNGRLSSEPIGMYGTPTMHKDKKSTE